MDADRSDDWEHGLLHASKRAFDHLALDFEPDQKKENRHQTIVDPVLKAL